MTVNQAVDEILEVHEKRQELAQPMRGFGLARLGSDSQMIDAGGCEGKPSGLLHRGRLSVWSGLV